MVRLGDVFPYIRNGASIKQNEKISGFPITRIETIADGNINRNRMGYAGIKKIEPYSSYILQDGDILMSHINSVKHLGKVARYIRLGDECIIHGMNLLNLRVDNKQLNSVFAYYFLSSYYFKKQLPNITKNSVNQSSFNITALKELQMPLPSLPRQHKMAEILSYTNNLIEKRKDQIKKLDLLVKALFVAMFGDPVTNPKGWEEKLLGDCGSFKNGINYCQLNDGMVIKCIGVGDFGQLYRIDDLHGISEIYLSSEPSEEFILKDHDIIFVRSNGNKELVGRSVEVFPREEKITFSGFCIRYRNENENLLTVYLNHVLHLPSIKTKLLIDGRGANIQNINQRTLSSLRVPLPPLPLQTRFAEIVQQIDKGRFVMQEGLTKLELTYKALMQQYFG